MRARILIVDDDHRWVNLARRDLEGFETAVAIDKRMTLTKLRSKAFDLVIVGSRHLDVLEAIAMDYPHVRVAVATVQPRRCEALETLPRFCGQGVKLHSAADGRVAHRPPG